MADALTEIFRAASKHPNSRVSKLIHQVEEQTTQKNIVLLLIELAEHAEFSIDFNVSLKYYLDLYERCGINHELVLNEAGLLLISSSKIYSKRLDYVQSIVERQILTLSNADGEQQKLEQEQKENATPAENPKKSRKRALEAPRDQYEVELAPKKFKKLTQEKRFALPKVPTKAKQISRNIEMEQYIHPAGWQHAVIYDFENEEDVDTKRNYKLFTYHIEHRYNTLVPDINFRLHFKVKDYMDEQEELEENEACNTDRSWPPLSEAYVQKYLRLENYVLEQDVKACKRKATDQEYRKEILAKIKNIEPANETQLQLNTCNTNEPLASRNSVEQTTQECNVTLDTDSANKTLDNLEKTNDSGLSQSILDESNNTFQSSNLNYTLENSQECNVTNVSADSVNKTQDNLEKTNDSGLSQSILDESINTFQNTNLNYTSENSHIQENLSDNNITVNEVTYDSALGLSILEQTSTESVNTTTTNGSALETCFLEHNSNVENAATHENDSSDSNIEKSVNNSPSDLKAVDQNEAQEVINTILEDSEKAINNRENSAISDDRLQSISTDDVDMSVERLAKSNNKLNIDVMQQQDKNSTQIHIHLPSADDEGVCLSDLEERDCRLLSPIIKTSNILPGVERKDVTILMDDELRQALEMRDGILKHFGHETYTVPIINETRAQNLNFNIFKLPEKLLRKKVLFKLGPDMDLFLQARFLKRTRQDHAVRAGRNFQLQRFAPNNGDITDQTSGSDFCGFYDSDDDSMSSSDFCGFTEEEQEASKIHSLNRLSRDSGVGVDGSNLTPDKESVELLFENGNCKSSLISNNMETETTESIIQQLPNEIREALTLELSENCENNIEPSSPSTSNNTEETKILTADTTQIISESTGNLPAANNVKESEKNSKACSLTDTQETVGVLTENSGENLTCAEESLTNSQSLQSNESLEDPNEIEATTDTQSNADILKATVEGMSYNETSSLEQSNESDEPSTNKTSVNFKNHDNDVEINEVDSDNFMLDLNSQGNKTKIQQWHEHLQPILAKSRERHHFDVYQLGTNIIDTVQTKAASATIGHFTTASFEDIMEDKDTSYVSRYFLSTLLLANQSNIEISIQNKSSETPSAWHDINLKLLSTKRHTVAIEDNIGMIDGKQKTKIQKVKQNSKEVQRNDGKSHQDEGGKEDENMSLIKLQNSTSSNLKTHLKRSSNCARISCGIAEKKPKEIVCATSTKSQNKTLPHLIQSVQILNTNVDTSILASTSHQAQQKNLYLNVNMNTIRTLQPIEKVQTTSDDLDSGIFSVDEMSTS